MEYKIPQEKFEAHKNPAELSQAVISADYIANRARGRKEVLQCLHSSDVEKETPGDIEIFLNNGGKGIELTFNETCLIFGIAYIFSQYDAPPPYIVCTEKELYRALKYEQKFDGRRRQRLGETLAALSKKKFPLQWSEDEMIEGKKRKVRWIALACLFELARGFWDNGEFKETPPKENFELFRIELNEKIFGRVHKSFRLIDPNIGREIREYRRKQRRNGRATKYDIRLYDLLLNRNTTPIRRNYLKIAQAPMLMDNMIKNRKKKDIREKLDDIYEMYCHMGYLTDFNVDQKGTRHEVDVLYLNSDKIYGLQDVKK